jgi:hypothetical protein
LGLSYNVGDSDTLTRGEERKRKEKEKKKRQEKGDKRGTQNLNGLRVKDVNVALVAVAKQQSRVRRAINELINPEMDTSECRSWI